MKRRGVVAPWGWERSLGYDSPRALVKIDLGTIKDEGVRRVRAASRSRTLGIHEGTADSTNPEYWIAKGISGSTTLQGYVHGTTWNAN